MKKLLTIATAMLLLQSCKQTKDCPALDAKYMTLANYTQDSTITFVNATGNQINFTVASEAASAPYTTECDRGELGEDCGITSCKATASFSATSDSTRGGLNTFSISMVANFRGNQSNLENQSDLIIHLLDYFDYEPLNSETIVMARDTLLIHYTLGSHTYDTIRTKSVDTFTTKSKVWRVYISNTQGIVAFADKQTNSIFYLK